MALMSWTGTPYQGGATPYVDMPDGTRLEQVRRDPIQDAQTTAAYNQVMAQQAAARQPQLATFGVQGSGPLVAGVGATPAAPSFPSIGGGSGGSNIQIPGVPQLQTATAPTMPNFGANNANAGSNQFSAQLQQLIAQLQGQAGESDSALRDRANQQIAAQRAVLDRRADRDVQRSLAQNGLLPTGGLSSRMRQQISEPYEDQLAAASAGINGDLRNQRTATANNLVSSISSLQNSQNAAANEAIRLQQQAQMNQYQMQMSQYEAQVRANETAYQRAMDQYNLQQRQQQATQSQQARQQAAYQDSVGGGGISGGSMTGSVTGWNGGQNSFLDDGPQPRDLYNNMVNQQRASEARNYNQAAADRFNASNGGTGYTFTGNTGNGVSSAGSYTGVSMTGPLVGSMVRNAGQQVSGYGGYGGSPSYNTAMGIGGIVGGAAQSLGGTYSNSGYGRSMY